MKKIVVTTIMFLVTLTSYCYGQDTQITVAKDGSGDYATVQEAFDAIPENNTESITVFVKNGIYDEKILLSSNKSNITLIGESKDSTILTHDDYSGKVVDGVTLGTSTSYSVAIDASDFIAKNITFQNSYDGAQAVALRVNGDRVTFVNCNILGYQDTYYTWGYGRIYNLDCYIEGTTDFIFGRSIAVFENCTINSKKNSTITAASTELNYLFGYVFINCVLTADPGVDKGQLGRPWRDYARTVYITTEEGAHIDPVGWSDWDGRSATCYYAEYNCSGPGYTPEQRVLWSHQLTVEEATEYTIENIFSKNSASPFYNNDWIPPVELPGILTPPVNLKGELKSINSVELNWQDNSGKENGVKIERREESSDFAVIDSVAADVTTYQDTGLAEITHYFYRVFAFNDTLESVYSNIVDVTTLSPTVKALPAFNPYPSNEATFIGTDSEIKWEAGLNTVSHNVYFGKVNPPPFIGNQEDTVFVPNSLDKATTYYWRIDEINPTDSVTEGVVWQFTTKLNLPPSIVAEWNFDDASGNTLSDESIYNNNGTLFNMGSGSWTTGIEEGALKFDGINDYILVPHHGVFDFDNESFSVSLWAKVDTLTGSSIYLLSKGSFSEDVVRQTSGKWYGFEIKNNEMRFSIDDNLVKTGINISGIDAIAGKNWFHLVGQRDKDSSVTRLYINGQLRGVADDLTGDISENEDMYIGNTINHDVTFWGYLDDIRIYNYVLSKAEIEEIYNKYVTSIDNKNYVPTKFSLEQNYPNPFNPTTMISYHLPTSGRVVLKVYDILGKEVVTLINEEKPAGSYEEKFDAERLSSGIYVYQLSYSNKVLTKKMLLLR